MEADLFISLFYCEIKLFHSIYPQKKILPRFLYEQEREEDAARVSPPRGGVGSAEEQSLTQLNESSGQAAFKTKSISLQSLLCLLDTNLNENSS